MGTRDYKQYIITLPKEYGEDLKNRGIDSLFIIFDRGLGAFPKIEGFTEEALLTFMKKHPELQKLFSQVTAEQETASKLAQAQSTKEAEQPWRIVPFSPTGVLGRMEDASDF